MVRYLPMSDADSAINALLDDLSGTIESELLSLGRGDTPYLLLILSQNGPHVCGTVTPEGLEATGKLLIAMAAEAKKGHPLSAPDRKN